MKFELSFNNRKRFPDRDLLDDLKKVASELGKETVSVEEYNKKGRYHSGTIAIRFGGWHKAIEMAGLTMFIPLKKIKDEDLLNDLKKVAQEFGKENITNNEYDERGKYGSSTITSRFGGWNKALEIVGLTIKHYHGVSAEELINDLKKVAKVLGKENIKSREYDENGKYASSTIAERFENWNKALEKAGLVIKYHQNITTDDLFENIEQVWLKLGRQPSKREMKFPLSKYSYAVYTRKFETWKNALEKFVEFSNSEEVETEQTIETKPGDIQQINSTEIEEK